MSRRHNAYIAAASFAVAAAAIVVLATHSWSGPPSVGANPVSAGEWIYRTGADRNGSPAPYSGGMMMRASCADCHGIDGRGREAMMFSAPNITYANLTDPKGLLESDGSRGPTYTDATLHRAVTAGIDPEGDHLAWPMPQWRLTDRQWSELLAYLKTLQ